VLSAESLAEGCERLYGDRTYTIHRADLLSTIATAVPADTVRLGSRCTAVEPSDDVAVLTFADGSRATAEVVIGADGVHSCVRNAVIGPSPATFSGMCAFRALIPARRAPAMARRPVHTLWLGPDRHAVHYPISAGALINVVAFGPAGADVVESWSASATVEEFLAEFDGWDVRLRELIAAGEALGRWALLDRAPLERWSLGPVALLGDAAHPMFPFFAQGAAQSIEDAAVLARCLANDLTDPGRALRRYAEIRMERTSRLQVMSRERARVNHLPDGPEQRLRDESLGGQDPLAASGWIYGYDAESAEGGGSVVTLPSSC
jgi:salicylate hydroxylase